MAIQYPNWFAAPQLETPDFLGEYMKGYRASKEPAAIRRQEEQERLANALKGLEYQYAPQQYEQEAEKRALSNAFQARENEAQPEDIRLRQLNDALKAQGQHLSHDQLRQLIRHSEAEHPLTMAEKRAKIYEALNKPAPLTPAQAAEEKERAKHKVGFSNQVGEDLLGLAQQRQSLDYMGGLLTNYNDILKNSIGPISSVVEKYAGPESSQALLAQIDSASGEMVLSVLKSIPGASSNKELDFAQNMKLSGNDTYQAFQAKYHALKAFNDLATERYKLINENLKTMPKNEAILDAVERTPSAEIIKHYQGLANPERSKSGKTSSIEGKPTSSLLKSLWGKK